MISIYSTLPPEIEAHLINSNDWLMDKAATNDESIVNLGCYSEHDERTGKWSNYVLYALNEHNGHVSFGAQYGYRLGQYISHEIDTTTSKPLEYCGSCRAITVAVIRYLTIQSKEHHKIMDQISTGSYMF